jgi:hypothetical protein
MHWLASVSTRHAPALSAAATFGGLACRANGGAFLRTLALCRNSATVGAIGLI